jgi:arylsulfatase A-like enzyme
MNYRNICSIIFASLLSFGCSEKEPLIPQEARRPNVVLIITDDQGYGDIAAHGNPVIKTPNLDKLHAESIRFTDFHVDPTCSPTRGALLTGKYSHRARVWHTICGGNHLRATEKTMANAFADAGYRTGAFGKWHLGSNYPYRPMDRGFQEWLGQGDGGTGTTDCWFFNDRVDDHYWHNGEWVQRDGYAPDVFFNAAIDFIDAGEAPFFIYLATYMPHTPHTIPDKSWLKPYLDAGMTERVAYFFAGIERIDRNIGRLRAALEISGKAENTIFIFMTDNGGTAGGGIIQRRDAGPKRSRLRRWPPGPLLHPLAGRKH